MTLIEINPNGPDEPERKLGKPIEEMARAICCPDGCEGDTGSGRPCDIRREDSTAIFQARAALTVLRRHGWITSDCIDAIHAEEDDNGEARSSIIGGGK